MSKYILMFLAAAGIMAAVRPVCGQTPIAAGINGGIIEFTDFSAREIPMCREPGQEPFNFLLFTEKEYEVYNSESGKQKATGFSTKYPALIFVYAVKGGEESAQQIANNAYYQSGAIRPEPWPGVPGPEYVLKLAVAAGSDDTWIKVVPYLALGRGCYYEYPNMPPAGGECPRGMDDVSYSGSYSIPKPFYIPYNESYMRFVPWADVVTQEHSFYFEPQITVYDAPDGKAVDKPFEAYYGRLAGALEGDWAPVYLFADPYEAYETNYQGWIRWRDANGLTIAPRSMHIGGPLI